MPISYVGKTPMEIPGIVKTIIPPEGGWKPKTYYIVEAAFSKNNPIHRLIFYSGFLNNGVPNGYNEFCRTEDRLEYLDACFIKAVREIDIDA